MQNRIKDLREDHDLTQQQIASAIGITQRKYSYLETGTQPLTDELLVRLAAYCGVGIDYLLMQTGRPDRYERQPRPSSKKGRAARTRRPALVLPDEAHTSLLK